MGFQDHLQQHLFEQVLESQSQHLCWLLSSQAIATEATIQGSEFGRLMGATKLWDGIIMRQNCSVRDKLLRAVEGKSCGPIFQREIKGNVFPPSTRYMTWRKDEWTRVKSGEDLRVWREAIVVMVAVMTSLLWQAGQK